MNANDNRLSSEFGGRVVLNEAVSIARSELEASAELAPFVVTKGWGDCEVERFSEGLGQARARFDELSTGRRQSVTAPLRTSPTPPTVRPRS
jgi:hypothetical protein